MWLLSAVAAAGAAQSAVVLLVVPLRMVSFSREAFGLGQQEEQHTHQGGKLRWTSPMSYMESAARRARDTRLTLLIHVSRWIIKRAEVSLDVYPSIRLAVSRLRV